MPIRILLLALLVFLMCTPASLQGLTIIEPSPLPPGLVGIPYAGGIAYTQASEPVTFTVLGGSLPPGVTLSSSGLFSGTPTAGGTFTFTVGATDQDMQSDSKEFSLTITVPTPVSLPNGVVAQTYSRTLPDPGPSGPFTFTLIGGALPPGLSMSSAGLISGTPSTAGTYDFVVHALSEFGPAYGLFRIVVAAPFAFVTPSPLPAGTAGVAYSLLMGVSGGNPPYTWSVVGGSLPAGLSLSAAGILSGTPATPVAATFTTRVTDNLGYFAQNVYLLTINAPSGGPPVILTTSPLPQGTVGQTYNVALAASGGTGPYTWSLVTGTLPPGVVLSTSGTLSGTPTSSGTFNFTARASDSLGVQVQKAFALTVNAGVQTLGITTTSPLPHATQGQAYNLLFAAAGGTGPYTWTLLSGTLPGGLALASNGTLSGTSGSTGTSTFTVKVTGQNGQTASGQFTLTVSELLVITGVSPLTTGMVGSPYSSTFTASGGVPPYGWALAAGTLPAGLTLSPAGVLSGTPTAAGTFNFSVTASDTTVTTPARPFQLTIVPALTIQSSSPLPGGVVSRPYSFALVAAGGFPPYVFNQVDGALPAGVSLNSSGVVSGTPTAGGGFVVQVRVTDARGNTASRSFDLTVTVAPTITTRTIPNGSINQPYSVAFAAAGGTQPFEWRISSGIAPPGLTLSSAGVLSGTPTAAGPFALVVQVVDKNGATDSVTVTASIAPAPLTVLSQPQLPQAILNRAYSQTLQASGGVPPYTWSMATGTLPTGVSLMSSGELRGTPTSLGNFDFSISLTDSGPAATAQAGLLNAKASPGDERLASTSFPFRLTVAPPPIEITTTSPLPEAVAGIAYSTTLVATGGRAAIVWAVTGGTLPGGLTLNASTGVISGIPASEGSVTFTIQARDNAGPAALRTFTLAVRQESDLVLSTLEVVFRGSAGGSTPPSQSISVVSRLSRLTGYRVTHEPAPWLRLLSGAEGSTPGHFVAGAVITGLAAGSYRTSMLVEGIETRQVIAVPVTLELTAVPPRIGLSPDGVRIDRSTPNDNPAPNVVLSNAGGGGNVTFSASVVEGLAWLTITPAQGTIRPDGSVPIRFSVNSSRLPFGFSRGLVRIVSTAGTSDLPVTVENPSQPRFLRLDPEGITVQARQGNGAPQPSRSFRLLNPGTQALGWTAGVVGDTGWLRLGRRSGSVPAGGSDSVDLTIDTAALLPGVYYGRVQVTAPEAQNNLQDFIVVLRVVSQNEPPVPEPSPSGLLFVFPEGTTAPPVQTVKVHTSSAAPIAYQAAPFTGGRVDWLAAEAATGVTSTQAPADVQIRVSGANLKRGVYSGFVNFSLSSTLVRSVQVTTIVTPPVARTAAESDRSLAGCAPAKLVATHTGLVGNFSSPVAWPTPLAVRVVDDCGDPVPTAQVVANFSNGDPPLAMRLTDGRTGQYSATWTPGLSSSQLSITANVAESRLGVASTELIGTVTANRAPIIGRSAILHSFYPQIGAAVAPGNLVQILGSDLAAAETTASFPAPTTLGGVTVLVGGRPAPLLYVSPTQINAQLPFGLATESSHAVLVSSGDRLAAPQAASLNSVQPGIASDADATALARRLDGSLITAANPALPGETIQIFLAGLGPTTPAVPAGAVAPADPPALIQAPVVVRINGRSADTTFAGLAPGLVGVYQVDLTIPAGLAAGTGELIVEQSGRTSNTVRIAIGAP
ncbi:MAG: putative Ig domain-containing protein [Bryobacteraceae bacterium]